MYYYNRVIEVTLVGILYRKPNKRFFIISFKNKLAAGL